MHFALAQILIQEIIILDEISGLFYFFFISFSKSNSPFTFYAQWNTVMILEMTADIRNLRLSRHEKVVL